MKYIVILMVCAVSIVGSQSFSGAVEPILTGELIREAMREAENYEYRDTAVLKEVCFSVSIKTPYDELRVAEWSVRQHIKDPSEQARMIDSYRRSSGVSITASACPMKHSRPLMILLKQGEQIIWPLFLSQRSASDYPGLSESEELSKIVTLTNTP